MGAQGYRVSDLLKNLFESILFLLRCNSYYNISFSIIYEKDKRVVKVLADQELHLPYE